MRRCVCLRRTAKPPSPSPGGRSQAPDADPHRAPRRLPLCPHGEPGMKSWSWLSDTVARRFAVTEVLAVAVTLALVGLFRTFSGAWSNEPLENSSLLNEAADIVRMIE